MKNTSTHPAKKPLMVAAAVLCVLLVLVVLAGAGDTVVYTLTSLFMAAVGGVIYLAQNKQN